MKLPKSELDNVYIDESKIKAPGLDEIQTIDILSTYCVEFRTGDFIKTTLNKLNWTTNKIECTKENYLLLLRNEYNYLAKQKAGNDILDKITEEIRLVENSPHNNFDAIKDEYEKTIETLENQLDNWNSQPYGVFVELNDNDLVSLEYLHSEIRSEIASYRKKLVGLLLQLSIPAVMALMLSEIYKKNLDHYALKIVLLAAVINTIVQFILIQRHFKKASDPYGHINEKIITPAIKDPVDFKIQAYKNKIAEIDKSTSSTAKVLIDLKNTLSELETIQEAGPDT